MTSAMMNASAHVAAIIAVQVTQPMRLFECLCGEFWKILKKMNLADTDYSTGQRFVFTWSIPHTEYNDPRYTIVGIAKEKAIFLNVGCKDPKAGATIYWLPTKWYMIVPHKTKTMISHIVTVHSAKGRWVIDYWMKEFLSPLGKSLGSRISAMNYVR